MTTKAKKISETERDRGAPLNFKEICALARCAESTMRKLISEGNGPPTFTRPGGKRLLAYESEVRAWLNSARTAAS